MFIFNFFKNNKNNKKKIKKSYNKSPTNISIIFFTNTCFNYIIKFI